MSTARPSSDFFTALFRAVGFALAVYLSYKFLEWLCERPREFAEQIGQARDRQIEYLEARVDQFQEAYQQVNVLLDQRRQELLLKWCNFALRLAHFIAWVYLSLVAAS